MLSIENPPSDLQLKSGDDDDDDVDGDNIKTSSLSDAVVADLPKFSIRDYVFSARNKDIATNWPFSEKNLQLCRKHGVTNLLPPFQPRNSVREQSVKICALYGSSLDRKRLSNSSENCRRQSEQNESVYADSSFFNQKLNLDHMHITSIVSDQEDREIPSAVEQSHSEKDSEAAILLESSAKTEKSILAPVKKSKMMVKLGTLAGQSVKEDNMTGSLMVSETMASKVCPVCKTFSFSSNTTLNAHIDQCLAGESTMKGTADPKVIKHRIKPRKTRSMVDIYATAQHCTLEDLDRRNGTNWANNSTPPDQPNELSFEERAEKFPTAPIEETAQEGAVYIDPNGTKVRILSKFSMANVEGTPGPQYIPKGDKGSKILTGKRKKKHHLQKQQKFLKLAAHGKACSPKPYSNYENRDGPNRNLAVEQSGEEEVQRGQCSDAREQIKPVDMGIIRQWVGSKRTGLAKKTTRQDNHQLSGHNLKDPVGERYHSSNAGQNSSKQLVSPQSSKRMETSSTERGSCLSREQPPLKRKREELPFLSSKALGYGKRSMTIPKHRKLTKEGTPTRDSCKNSPNCAVRGASSLSYKAVDVNAAPTKTTDAFVSISKSSCSQQPFSSKATKFTATTKKLLLKNQAVAPKSRSGVKIISSGPTRSQVNSKLRIGFVGRPSPNDDNQRLDPEPDFIDENPKLKEITFKTPYNQSRMLRIRKSRGSIKESRQEEAADGSKSSESESDYYGHGVGEPKEFSPVSSVRAFEDSEDSHDSEESESEESESEEALAPGEHIVTESTSNIAIRESFLSSSNSLDPKFHELPSSPGKSKSKQCAEVDQRHICGHKCLICPDDISTGDKQVFYSADEVGQVMIGEDTHMGAEFDTKDEQLNYFSEVDPIPIPGPPGSFLPSPRHMGSDDLQGISPSPRHMGSDDLQGISSLTSCRVQSTEYHHDLVDRDKSDSPISAISDMSNLSLAKSESRSSKNLNVESLAVQDEIRKGFPGAAQVSEATTLGPEQPVQDMLKLDAIFTEKPHVSSKFDELCCCSRKEGAQGVALNFQESQLLKRRTMLSVPFPVKQMDKNCSERFDNLNSRTEIFSLTSYPYSACEKVSYSSKKLASEHIEMKVSTGHDVIFPTHRDHDSASPSSSTPVLRLMGKNLMVFNKDDDVSLQHKQHQSASMNAHPHSVYRTDSGVSTGGAGNKDNHLYHQGFTKCPIFTQDRGQDAIRQQFDAKLPSNIECHIDIKTPATPFHAPGVKCGNMNAAATFSTPLGQNGNGCGRNMLTEEQRPKNRPENSLTYVLEKPFATSIGKSWDVGSSKEIIVIDDATDNEDESASGTMCNSGVRRTRGTSSSNLIPGGSKFASRFANPLYNNQLEGPGSLYSERPLLHHPSFQMPVSEGINASSLKWNCIPEGASFLPPSSLGAPSSSGGQLRPTFYYSPSFS